MVKNNNKKDLQKLAEYIAFQYDGKVTPIEEIVIDEELEVFYDNYESNTFDGMTIFDNDKFYIHLNLDKGNKRNSERGRFTLAHELGHYFIDSHRIGLKMGLLEPHASITNQKQFTLIEREADFFASCLLMPESRFLKDIGYKKFSFKTIDFLSAEYKVSRTAAAIRFSQIGNHPIMIVYAENNRIKWAYSSDDFPFKFFINDNIVPKYMVMGDYFNNTSSVDVFKTEEVWAIDCFKYVSDDDVNRKFFEHCISHQNSALSILWED